MRAVGVHLALRGPRPGLHQYTVRTEAGKASRTVAIDLSGRFPEVALGVPLVVKLDELLVPYGSFARVEIGNPHAVFFTTDAALSTLPLERDGPAIEKNSKFPNRTNVEFVSVITRRRLRVRVWERGAGATLACGSGACAVVAAAEAKGFVDAGERIEVELPGGSVFVRLASGWREGKGEAFLSGPAEDVFSGEWLGG
jgi:diaminopimelate epimerase